MTKISPALLQRPDRRQILLGGSLLLAAAAANMLRPRSRAGAPSVPALETVVPKSIGAYHYASSTGLIVPDEGQASDSYDQLLTRIYVAPELPPVMLLIAYGNAQDAGIALHRPEACYASAGYHISHRDEVPLSGVGGEQAIILSASQGDRTEQIYTWMRIGRRFPTSPMEEKFALAAANMRGQFAEGILLRLSVRSQHRRAALQQIEAFNMAFLHSLDAQGRGLLLGERAGG